MWQTEMVRIIRHTIGDLTTPYDYDDNRLTELIVVAAQEVMMEVQFAQDYIVDVDELIISPDPTDRENNTREDAFIVLVSLKAACKLDVNEARTAASQSITIRDDDSEIALGGLGQLKIKMLDAGACKTYEELKMSYISSRLVGTGILTKNYCGCNYGYPYSYPVDWRYR